MVAKEALKAQLISPGRIFIIGGHSNGQKLSRTPVLISETYERGNQCLDGRPAIELSAPILLGQRLAAIWQNCVSRRRSAGNSGSGSAFDGAFFSGYLSLGSHPVCHALFRQNSAK